MQLNLKESACTGLDFEKIKGEGEAFGTFMEVWKSAVFSSDSRIPSLDLVKYGQGIEVSAIPVPQEAMLKSLITAILDLSKPLALVIALFCVDATVLSVALPTQLHKK